MPDKLDAYERNLIAEALAAGRVTICPPRTYAIDLIEPITPRAVQDAQFARMARARRLREAEERRERAANPKRSNAVFSEAVREARREAVRELADGTLSVPDILKILEARGIPFTRDAVNKDVQWWRARGVDARTSGMSLSTATELAERREKVAALLAEGLSQRKIAERLGMRKATVGDDVKFLNKQRKAA